MTVSGTVQTNCTVAVDVTLSVTWLDGPDVPEGARAFVTVRHVQPGELRQFAEVVPAARGATRLHLSADVASSGLTRRR